MSQILDPVPTDRSDPICCCYVNSSSRVQVTRITNIENWYFERVAFPGQRLIFEAPMNAYLEIHTGNMASAVISDRIPCIRLQIDPLPDSFPPEHFPADQQERPLATTSSQP